MQCARTDFKNKLTDSDATSLNTKALWLRAFAQTMRLANSRAMLSHGTNFVRRISGTTQLVQPENSELPIS